LLIVSGAVVKANPIGGGLQISEHPSLLVNLLGGRKLYVQEGVSGGAWAAPRRNVQTSKISLLKQPTRKTSVETGKGRGNQGRTNLEKKH